MSFKTSPFLDSSTTYTIEGSMTLVMSGFRNWAGFNHESRWDWSTRSIGDGMRRLRDATDKDPSSYDFLARSLQYKNTAEEAGRALTGALASYFRSLERKGKSFVDRLGLGESDPVKLANNITNTILVNGFVPVGFHESNSRKELTPGVMSFPSFYILGVLPDDPTGSTNFMARISSHLRPAALAGFGDIDFDLGKKYEQRIDPNQKQPLSFHVWIDIESFGVFLTAKRVAYRYNALGEEPSKEDQRDIRRIYRKELEHLSQEVAAAEAQFIRAYVALTTFLELCTCLYSRRLANPAALPRLPLSDSWHFDRPELVETYAPDGKTVRASYEYIDGIVDQFDPHGEKPPTPQGAAFVSLYRNRCSVFLTYCTRMKDIMTSYKTYLAAVTDPLTVIFSPGSPATSQLEAMLMAVADSFPFIETQINSLAVVVSEASRDFTEIFGAGRVDIIRHKSLVLHDKWWAAVMNQELVGFSGARLSDSPKAYVQRLLRRSAAPVAVASRY